MINNKKKINNKKTSKLSTQLFCNYPKTRRKKQEYKKLILPSVKLLKSFGLAENKVYSK